VIQLIHDFRLPQTAIESNKIAKKRSDPKYAMRFGLEE
jgi:hypothetical protein